MPTTFLFSDPDIDNNVYCIGYTGDVPSGFIALNTDTLSHPVIGLSAEVFSGNTFITGIEMLNLVVIFSNTGPSGAFQNCVNLITATFRDLTTIQSDNCFQGCDNLVDITIDNVGTLPIYCFHSCTSLSYIKLLSTTAINNYAFFGCTSLQYVFIGTNNPPIANDTIFDNTGPLLNVYIQASASGWGTTFATKPVIVMELPLVPEGPVIENYTGFGTATISATSVSPVLNYSWYINDVFNTDTSSPTTMIPTPNVGDTYYVIVSDAFNQLTVSPVTTYNPQPPKPLGLGPLNNPSAYGVNLGVYGTCSPPTGFETTPLAYFFRIIVDGIEGAPIAKYTTPTTDQIIKFQYGNLPIGPVYQIEFWAETETLQSEHFISAFIPLPPGEDRVVSEGRYNVTAQQKVLVIGETATFPGDIAIIYVSGSSADILLQAGRVPTNQPTMYFTVQEFARTGQNVIDAFSLIGSNANGTALSEDTILEIEVPVTGVAAGDTINLYALGENPGAAEIAAKAAQDAEDLAKAAKTTAEQAAAVAAAAVAAVAALASQIATLANSLQPQRNQFGNPVVKIQRKIGNGTVYILTAPISGFTEGVVTTNQAYNNALIDSSARTIQKQDYTLARGFYRQTLDSSTLTRIRQANSVLVDQQGINAQFGAGCCMPIPGEPILLVNNSL